MCKQLNKDPEDDKDRKIDKLRNINFKLIKQLHDLNYLIQRTIEHGEQQKRSKSRDSISPVPKDRCKAKNDPNYMVKTKEIELVKVTRQV